MINNKYNPMQIIAHRGASALEPENTLKSFIKAMKLGVDMVECDVRTTLDGQLVIHHDPYLDRTTNGTGLVKNKSLSELRQLNAGDGERIPTLREAIDTVKGQVGMVIEVKDPGSEEKILNLIKEEKIAAEVIIASFYHRVSLNIKSLDPEISTGVIFACQPINSVAMAIDAQADIIFPQYQYLNKLMVDEAHDHGIKVVAGVIDDPITVENVVSWEVDAVVTNNPAIMKFVFPFD